MGLVKRNLYRLPWSMNDNPIGWIEATDECNIHCIGCYRKQIAGHRAVKDLKADIDFLKKWRNVYHICIAGGEALLHPNIDEIVHYTHQNGIKPLLLTNGKGLTYELLAELKQAGLSGVGFHVDCMQQRSPKWNGKTEAELNELRSELVELMARVGGLYCYFGMTVYRSNYDQINDFIHWGNRNIENVQALLFITFRAAPLDLGYSYKDAMGNPVDIADLGYALDKNLREDAGLTSHDIWLKIREEFPHYDACCYLGGSQDHEAIKWLLGAQLGFKDQMIGSLGPRSMEIFQVAHHLFDGRYLSIRAEHKMPRAIFGLGLFDPKVRAAHRVFWRSVIRRPLRLFSPLYAQSVSIVQAPDIMADGRTDMCESCPDMAVWEGKLVHSCRMDEWRLYGSYISPQVGEDVEENQREHEPTGQPAR